MDFDSIMQEITSGLTGISKDDIPYLMKQSEKYKTNPFAKEIARACGRLMFDLIPDDKKAEFQQAIGNDSAGINSTLDEIRFVAYKKDFRKALVLMEVLVNRIETMDAFAVNTAAIKTLDLYENEGTLFSRREADISIKGIGTTKAYVYVYNKSVDAREMIPLCRQP